MILLPGKNWGCAFFFLLNNNLYTYNLKHKKWTVQFWSFGLKLLPIFVMVTRWKTMNIFMNTVSQSAN